MGLDMNLTAEYYIGGAKNRVEVEKTGYDDKDESFVFENVHTVGVNIGYWRKANAIHKWFVDNVQDGNDDCKRYYVSSENLDALKDACETVLQARWTKQEEDVAMEILPPCEGFFFGGTEIDEYYFSDIEDTLDIIKKAKEALENGADIYYSSSW